MAEESIVINEINYNSADSLFPKDWVELYNVTTEPINIGNWIFRDDNDEHEFLIPNNQILPPDGYIVICDSLNAFTILFPDIENVIGDFDFKLKNDGELIRLFDDTGVLIDSVHYNDVEPWPLEADGDGPTLELINPHYDNELASNWLASSGFGTPGQQNSNYIVVSQDCLGVWGGETGYDECGVCNGNNSTCIDCADVPNGDNVEDMCGTCDDDNSNDCTQDCNGLWGGPDNTPNTGDEATYDLCFSESAPNGICGGDNSTCLDCANAPNGDSLEDNCGTCDTDASNDCVQDCNGDWGETAEYDDCTVPICSGGETGLIANASCTDCNEELNGSAYTDGCDVCVGGKTSLEACPQDCAGVDGGDALVDMCGTCDDDNSNDCTQDCNGLWGGPDNTPNTGDEATYDLCFSESAPNGICGGDNSTCTDCAEVPNGDNVEDMCGTCDDANSNDCTQDCNGDWGGSDNTPNTGDEATYDLCVSDSAPNGICGGDNSTCTGCMDSNACNYDESATINNTSSCTFVEVGFDCFGNLLSVNDFFPHDYQLNNIYPNPFNPVTTIGYTVPILTKVKLEVYNINGIKISVLIDNYISSGYHRVNWDASDHASGIYFVMMVADGYIATQKLMLVK